MDESSFAPPSHLSERAAALWADVVPRRAKTPGRLALIQTALESLDRADAARVAVAREGMTTITQRSGAMHIHPLLKVERESMQQFAKLWSQLGFQKEFNRGDI
jgi:phage terminase small subunit